MAISGPQKSSKNRTSFTQLCMEKSAPFLAKLRLAASEATDWGGIENWWFKM